MEGPSFATPTTIRRQVTLLFLCVTISFAHVPQKYLFFNLMTRQNFIGINAEAVL